MIGKRLAVVAALVATTFTTSAAAADTPRCGTYGEYDRVTNGLSVPSVRNIFDFAGNRTDGAERFWIRFRSCSGEVTFVVVFSAYSGLSIDKRVE